MSIENLKWQSLVSGNLPTQYLKLIFNGTDFKRELAAFDFAGFVRLDETMTSRPVFDFERVAYYLNLVCAENVAANRNHYGAVFSIEVGTDFVQFEESGLSDGVCQDTATDLLHLLVVESGLQCRWEAYSRYEDSGECSPLHTGTPKEIRALFPVGV